MTAYDDIPYESYPVPYASPAALALAARWAGGPQAPLSSPRVLELGCGDGAHLLPLAFHQPAGRFLGIDGSTRAVEAARRGAERLGLDNVRFECGDVAEVSVDGEWDFVLAHGLYSWIDPDRRLAVRRLMRRVLSSEGLGYICFNALPGWGVRGRVRDALAGLELDVARARAADIHRLVREDSSPWGQLLAHELSRAVDASDAYLAHEYLSPHNQAFWLHEVVRDFEAEGMRYAGDALALSHEGWVSPEMRAASAEVAPDAAGRELVVDLLVYRQLRGALFARDDAVSSSPADATLLDEAFVYGVLRTPEDPFDPRPGVEQRFEGRGALEVQVSSGVGKLALLELAARYPDGFDLPRLAERAVSALRELGFSPEVDALPALRDGLFELVRRRALDIRLDRPSLRSVPSDAPEASVLTRWEAERRAVVTSPTHVTLPLDPVDRAVVRRLRGEVDRAGVTEGLVADVEEGRLDLEGAPSSAFRLRPVLAERVERVVALLGWWGLLNSD